MTWLLLFLGVLGIAWLMFVPRTGERETRIPMGGPAGDHDRAAADAGVGRMVSTGETGPEAHPVHTYEVGAHATGVQPDGHTPGVDAYAAASHSEPVPTGATYAAGGGAQEDEPRGWLPEYDQQRTGDNVQGQV